MNSQLLYIVVLACVAGLILFRLYTVLGRRTGTERPPPERFERVTGSDERAPDAGKPVLLPDRSAASGTPKGLPDRLQQTLLDIKLADRTFDTGKFLEGAKRAYEIIVAAFAKGDREALHPLLSEEVYTAFQSVISEREAKSERVDFTFVAFGDVTITDAAVAGEVASVTISIPAQFISATLDSDGKVVHGDSKAVRSATDVWTFERNVRHSDPNWRLVSTSGEADLQDA